MEYYLWVSVLSSGSIRAKVLCPGLFATDLLGSLFVVHYETNDPLTGETWGEHSKFQISEQLALCWSCAVLMAACQHQSFRDRLSRCIYLQAEWSIVPAW